MSLNLLALARLLSQLNACGHHKADAVCASAAILRVLKKAAREGCFYSKECDEAIVRGIQSIEQCGKPRRGVVTGEEKLRVVKGHA